MPTFHESERFFIIPSLTTALKSAVNPWPRLSPSPTETGADDSIHSTPPVTIPRKSEE